MIGSSVGGMAVAQVLLRHFGRVTIVERDRLPDSPQPRKGVPRGCQPQAVIEFTRRSRPELPKSEHPGSAGVFTF